MNLNDIEKFAFGVSARTISTGAIGALGMHYFVEGAKGSVDIGGYDIPLWVIYGSLFATAGGVNESLKEVMKKYTPSTAWIYEFSPVSTGISAALLFYLASGLLGGVWMPDVKNLALAFTVGAVSDYSAMLVTDSVIHPITELKNIQSTAKSLLPEAHVLENFNPVNLNKINDLFMF